MELLLEQESKGYPDLAMKTFVPKHRGMKVEDYSKDPGTSFWEKVKRVDWVNVKDKKSAINVDKIEELARETYFPNSAILDKVLSDLRDGARIGVQEYYRVSSTSSNAPSSLDHGKEVTDALLDWLDEEYVIGPFKKEDIPFNKVKISGLMFRIKPNGKARIIINLSKGRPTSVNEGIEKREFPTAMSSTKAWIQILLRCGKNSRFCKNDWSSAYKQIRVHHEDVWLQGFSWLGRVFFELALVFGASSSPGIFDRLAKVVLHIVVNLSGFPSRLVIQHLDDVCACGPEGSDAVDKFYDTYKRTCEDLGIKLASADDPDKAFEPKCEGQVLGVDYDSTSMTWHLRQDKISIILSILHEVMEEGEATVRVLKKLCGKLVDIRCLIPGARFHLAHLLMVASSLAEPESFDTIVKVDEWCRADLFYFSLVLPVYSHRTVIQDPDRRPDSWAIKCHTDAAGGSTESLGRGVGMTIFPSTWTYVPWGRKINEGWTAYDGKNLSHKLSAWELLGPLLALVCGGNTLSGKQLEVYVDNAGSVVMWRKGWSTVCDLCNSMLLAIHQVATALACEIFITDIGRCSNKESIAADTLSKCEMGRFLENMPEANLAPEEVPSSLLSWIENPMPDRNLGSRIIKELSHKFDLVKYF